MNSTRRRCSIVAPMWIAWATLAGCGGEGATAGSAAAVPPPSAYAPPPAPPAPPAPAPTPTASAAPAPPTPNPQGAEVAEGQEHREHHHGGALSLVLMSLKDVDLSADQQASVDKIRTDLLGKMEPARAAEKDFASTLADGVAAGSVDRAKADAAINKLVTQVQGLQDASFAALDQLHAVLTAPQRAKLVDALQDALGEVEGGARSRRAGRSPASVGLPARPGRAPRPEPGAGREDQGELPRQDEGEPAGPRAQGGAGPPAGLRDGVQGRRVRREEARRREGGERTHRAMGCHAPGALPRSGGPRAHARPAHEARPGDPRPREPPGVVAGAPIERALRAAPLPEARPRPPRPPPARAHFFLDAFFALFLAGFPGDQTPSIAPAGSTKIPMMPFFPISMTGRMIFAPPFSAFARARLTSATST